MKERIKIILALIVLCLLVGFMAYYGNVYVKGGNVNYHPFLFLLIDIIF